MNPQVPPPAGRAVPPAAAAKVREQLRLFLIMTLGMIVVFQLPLPFNLGGLALGVATCWVGLRLIITIAEVRRSGGTGSGLPTAIIGLLLTGVMVVGLALQLVVFQPTMDQQRCISEANTLTARDICEQAYRDRISELTDRWSNPSTR